jgi:hypothetical protein
MKGFLLLSISSLLMISCATNRANYQVNVGNGNSRLPVQNVELKLDDKTRGEFEIIAPNKVAAAKPRKGDLPESLTVSWQDASGETFSESVEIDRMTRPDFKGQFVLEITKENTLTLTEIPSSGTELSTLPWAMPESWEGSVSIPGMDGR